MPKRKVCLLFLISSLALAGVFILKANLQTKILPPFFGFSYTDIRFDYHLLEGSPVPIPYVNFGFEYPVLLGLFFYLTGVVTSNYSGYFLLNGLLLSGASLGILYLLLKLQTLLHPGEKSSFLRLLILWGVSASALLFTVYNWDVVAVLLMLSGILAYYRQKPGLAGVLLALGAFFKLFPGFLLLPMLLLYAREKKWLFFKKSLATFLLTSLLVNLPFALNNFGFWSYFYKFSGGRGAYGDNIWSLVWTGSKKIWGEVSPYQQYYLPVVNYLSLGLFGLGYAGINWHVYKKGASFLTVSFFLISLFLLTSKTYSAPFSLWVLPFLVLLPVSLPLAVAFDWASAAVFYAFFQYLYYNDFLGMVQSPGHWFACTYTLVALRHVFLLLAGASVWWKLHRRIIKRI